MKNKRFLSNCITYGMVIAAFLVCTLLMNAGQMSRSVKAMLVPICCYIVLAVSLNLTVGISGELSLGHAGFMAIGTFTGTIAATWLAAAVPEMAVWVRLLLSVLAGGFLAMIFGALIGIPVLRLRGDYLAIVTLAFGEIIRNLLNIFYFSMDGAKGYFSFGNPNLPGKMVYNGAAGISGVKMISTFTAGFILVMVSLVVVLNLINSRSGRAIMATRDNRIAAESVGIQVTKYKMMAFVVSATLAGMAGALFGLNYYSLQPSKFNIDSSIQILVFVVMGGIGNIRGSVIAAVLLYVLPEVLRAFSLYRMLIYAVLLIAMMLITNSAWIKLLLARFRIFGKEHSDAQKGGLSHE